MIKGQPLTGNIKTPGLYDFESACMYICAINYALWSGKGLKSKWYILFSTPINHFHFFSSSFNDSNSGKLSLQELKAMMEKLGAPQTHLGLKEMIKVRNNVLNT